MHWSIQRVKDHKAISTSITNWMERHNTALAWKIIKARSGPVVQEKAIQCHSIDTKGWNLMLNNQLK